MEFLPIFFACVSTCRYRDSRVGDAEREPILCQRCLPRPPCRRSLCQVAHKLSASCRARADARRRAHRLSAGSEHLALADEGSAVGTDALDPEAIAACGQLLSVGAAAGEHEPVRAGGPVAGLFVAGHADRRPPAGGTSHRPRSWSGATTSAPPRGRRADRDAGLRDVARHADLRRAERGRRHHRLGRRVDRRHARRVPPSSARTCSVPENARPPRARRTRRSRRDRAGATSTGRRDGVTAPSRCAERDPEPAAGRRPGRAASAHPGRSGRASARPRARPARSTTASAPGMRATPAP